MRTAIGIKNLCGRITEDIWIVTIPNLTPSLSDHDSAQAAADLKEKGHIILKGLVTEFHLAQIYKQINAVFDVSLRSVGREDLVGAHVDEKYLFLEKEHPTLKSHCYDVISRVDSIHRIALHPAVIETARAFLDQSPIVPDLTQIRVDAPDNRMYQPFHQEVGQLSMRVMAMWCPLVDIDDSSGGLMIVPGSHKGGLVKHHYIDHPGMKKKVHAIRDGQFDPNDVMRIQLKAGDALLFHPHTFHGTAENLSDRIRWTVVTRYNELAEMHYLSDPDAGLRIDEKTGTR